MATTSTGQTLDITRGILDAASTRLYTHGQCAALAAALVEAGVGTPVFEVHLATSLDWSATTDRGLLEAGAEHLLVRLPDGRLLDAKGVYSSQAYASSHNSQHSRCVLVDMDAQEFVAFVRTGAICDLDMVAQDVDLAASFVDSVIAAYL